KTYARLLIKQIATALGIFSASIYQFYSAIGRGEIEPTFTVPAMNIRTITYDTARIVFRLALEKQIGPFVFEISRGEMDYTDQRPDEYTTAVLAAAIKEGYKGPVFLQADHSQFSIQRYQEDPEGERGRLMKLIDEVIAGQFYNIDIDASTLVDLSKENLDEQQKANYENTAALTKYIREKQPENITISVGGEIGHIGERNSTVADFEAFMSGFLKLVDQLTGISKVSVQTGTSHGGIPLPDGTMADVTVDFTVLKSISEIAREKFHIGGAVQHGASTLPNDLFDKFPQNKTLEIHLATGFQNIVYENMPQTLREEIYAWIETNLQKENQEGWTKEQFMYKARKKALGTFKKQLWELSDTDKQPILDVLETSLRSHFEKLGTFGTRNILDQIYP
ncbi:MAG TPA: class II fructose-bisphosphate aldolase, partial [Candidatus Saccharimonadales bacterium]|nr:class II fructose-bisphosphate aldolase [Candidatus Saccharimonadales bacterium]